MAADAPIVELNVGGIVYVTTLRTLTSQPDCLLADMFSSVARCQQYPDKLPSISSSSSSNCTHQLVKDSKGRYFIDRDGVLFRYVLDYLRNGGRLVLPECFHEHSRLRQEAEYFRLKGLLRFLSAEAINGGGSPFSQHQERQLTTLFSSATTIATTDSTGGVVAADPAATPAAVSPVSFAGGGGGREPGYVIVGYRGTFAFGRDGGVADVKFRKMWRILVSGRVSLCREVFRETLNESRDVDRGDGDRYTARFFLKHTFLEQAFDALLDAGFRLVGACGSGTNSAGDVKVGMDTEESKWNHYNEFVFCRG
jgi:hypothetical protein